MSVAETIRQEILTRQERTRDLAAARRLAGLIVIGRSFYDRCGDLAYLTNHFPPFPTTEFSPVARGLGHACLVLPVREAPTLIADGRAVRRDLVVVDDVRVTNDLVEGLVLVLREKGLERGPVGLVGTDLLPLAMERALRRDLPALDLVPADDLVRHQRLLKSPTEQALLARAAQVAEAGLRAAVAAAVGGGVRECDIAATGIAAALQAGADFVRYLRVHSGPWSGTSSRWPPATDRLVREHDIVTLDIIGACQGYQFDVLRTTLCGEALEEQRRLMDAALAATERTVEAVRPGVRVADLVALAHRCLDERGYGAYASPFIGHGIGLETVEAPLLQPGVEMTLQPGMVLCIEPSLRIPNWGGCCVEEEVLVTEDGYRPLTTFPARLW